MYLDKTKTDDRIGEVYLLKHEHYNHYRIGKTYNLALRGNEIKIELYWLKRFEAKRMNGDWFNLKPKT